MKIFFIFLCLFSSAAFAVPASVAQIVKSHGGKDLFYGLRDVEYHLQITDEKGRTDLSRERHLFDGERSSGLYFKREIPNSFSRKGPKCQKEEVFDGKETCCPLSSLSKTGHRYSDFRRQSNYFFFALPFKLLDADVKHKIISLDSGHVLDLEYKNSPGTRFRIFFENKNHLIQKIVFSSPDWRGGATTLVLPEFKTVNGLRIMVKRTFFDGDWTGQKKGRAIESHQISEIHFWNGFGPDDFSCKQRAAKSTHLGGE